MKVTRNLVVPSVHSLPRTDMVAQMCPQETQGPSTALLLAALAVTPLGMTGLAGWRGRCAGQDVTPGKASPQRLKPQSAATVARRLKPSPDTNRLGHELSRDWLLAPQLPRTSLDTMQKVPRLRFCSRRS